MRSVPEGTSGQPAAQQIEHALAVPYAAAFYLRFCDAIERFTAASVARDPGAFRVRGVELRYVVERILYFALQTNARLYDCYVARADGNDMGIAKDLEGPAQLLAPYVLDQPAPAAARGGLWHRFLRLVYQGHGRSVLRCATRSGGPAKVLFLVIQPKFVRYLRPIAEALPVESAFLTYDDPQTFKWLEAEGLPRVAIDLSPESRELVKSPAKLGGFDYALGPFDDLAVSFNAVRHALKELGPDCIVVPEGNAPINELINRAARALAIPTLCVQQGWSPFIHPGFRNMTFSRMCVWGRGFAEQLSPFNPGQIFVETGNHMIDCCRQEDDRNRNAIAFFLQKDFRLISESAWNSMLELIRWASASFPDTEVRVREHPSSPLSELEVASFDRLANVRLMPAHVATLDDSLRGCSVAIAMYSTTILEAAAMGVVPLIVSVVGFEHYNPNIAAQGAAVEVWDFAQAREALSRLVGDQPYRSSFAAGLDHVRHRYFARSRADAVAAIVGEIEALRCGRTADREIRR